MTAHALGSPTMEAIIVLLVTVALVLERIERVLEAIRKLRK